MLNTCLTALEIICMKYRLTSIQMSRAFSRKYSTWFLFYLELKTTKQMFQHVHVWHLRCNSKVLSTYLKQQDSSFKCKQATTTLITTKRSCPGVQTSNVLPEDVQNILFRLYFLRTILFPRLRDGFDGDWDESVYFLLSSSSAEGCLSRLGRAGRAGLSVEWEGPGSWLR